MDSPAIAPLVAARKLSFLSHEWFPVPRMLFPKAAGVDISDASIKWVVLEPASWGKRIASWGEEPLEDGIVVQGLIKDLPRLSKALADVRAHLGGVECAHAALPEESAFVFSMHVPHGSSRQQTISMIEFELEARVPLSPGAAVYDFNVIDESREIGQEIGVVVFPRDLALSYESVFSEARMQLLSLELEARSIARAVSEGSENEPTTLLVDFGRARTGFAVLRRGIPIFTSTVAVGGDALIRAVTERMSISEEEARAFNDEKGLRAPGGVKAPEVEAISGVVASLADEIVRHFHYWDTRRNEKGERMTPVERVFLLGGASNLKGLADYVALRVQAPTQRPDVWRHVASFDDYIPPIDRRASLQYATAIGLALRAV